MYLFDTYVGPVYCPTLTLLRPGGAGADSARMQFGRSDVCS